MSDLGSQIQGTREEQSGQSRLRLTNSDGSCGEPGVLPDVLEGSCLRSGSVHLRGDNSEGAETADRDLNLDALGIQRLRLQALPGHVGEVPAHMNDTSGPRCRRASTRPAASPRGTSSGPLPLGGRCPRAKST